MSKTPTPSSQLIFSTYEKIPESPQQWGLDERGFRALTKVRWVVTEKIHGANFCFVVHNGTIRCANRREFLSPDDPFYGYQRVLARLRSQVLEAATLALQGKGIATIAIYGELFGGSYPHPLILDDPAVQPVQTGVFYAPGVEFCVFDIAVEAAPDGERRYLDYAEMRAICHQTGLMVAEPLLIGTYTSAMDYPVSFGSTIPRRLGLPPLVEPNLAEGIVIKPVTTIMLPGGGGNIRPVLKKKIPAFAEKGRYDAAQPWPSPQAEERRPLDILQWEAYMMVTTARLQSATSKIGPGRPGDGSHAQRLFRLLVDDIMEQIGAEQGELLLQLSPTERETLHRFVQIETRALLKQRSSI